MNSRGSKLLTALAALLCSALPALAVDKTWTGASSTVWATAGNWSPAGAPGVNDRAIIVVRPNAPTLLASTLINRLVVQPNATLTIATGVTLSLSATATPVIDGTGTVLTPGTGLVRFIDGPNNATLFNASMTLGNFTVNPANATRDYFTTPGITLTFNGSLTLLNGRLRFGTAAVAAPVQADINGNFAVLGASSVFTATAGSMSVSGNFLCDGSFVHASGAVTMDGTGSIGGSSPTLAFNGLFVNGPIGSVVTAARSFSTAALFWVQQGTLTTAGVVPPVTITALLGAEVGNGVGAAGTARLDLRGGSRLEIQSGTSFLVNAPDGLFSADSEASGTPTLTRVGAGIFNAVVSGGIDVRRLNFSYGDLEGLEIAATATVTNLRGIAFSGANSTANARFLTIRSPGVSLDCPGCTFVALPVGTFNVWVQDTAPADAAPLRVRLENRGLAPAVGGGGPGAGDASDADDDANDNGVIDGSETVSANHGGAIVQWVYTANVDLTGQVRGFPMPAFDWNTFVYYSTYVLARDSLSTGEDRIYVLNSEGDLKPYSFTLTGIGAGDIVGPLFWNSEGAAHVVYFGTSTGRVYRLLDTGAGLVPPSSGPWTTPFMNTQDMDEVTSAIISDGVNLYFGGRKGGLEGVFKLSIATKALVGGQISTINQRVGTAPSYADGATTKYLYCGTTVGGSTSHLYRIHVNNWVIEADFRNSSYAPDPIDMTSDVVAYVNVPVDTLYVGEVNGRMHALPALGTAAQFVTPVTGYPFRDAASSAIRGGAYRQSFPVARLVYGDSGGRLYTLNGTLPATPVLNTDYFRLSTGTSAIQTLPLSQSGILYAANVAGQLFVADARTGVSPSQSILQTWNFGASALSDVSRDFSTSRIYVGTAGGRVYSVPETADPTPLFP